jgi:transposase InsO family protein
VPWKEATKVSLRREFVTLASQPGANISVLCHRFDISRKTGYKWLRRFEEEGAVGLEDRSRRPHRSPNRTSAHVEEVVCGVRRAHPAWSGYKIRHFLLRKARNGAGPIEPFEVPAASTCQAILDRYGLVAPSEPQEHGGWTRFEKERPNELWQMDFKGDFPATDGAQIHPLTVLDDHSRFALVLRACADQRFGTVQEQLTRTFRRYGLPDRMLMDNGPPWGAPYTAGRLDPPHHTRFTVWLMRIGVGVTHSRPFHPQTLGKDERFHRALEAEVLRHGPFTSVDHTQKRFDDWREVYNLERPHEALDMGVPAEHYRPSGRPFPTELPAIEYRASDLVKRVYSNGRIRLDGHQFRIGAAFGGLRVALRPTAEKGRWQVFFCHQKIREIDQSQPVQ